jgi:hypothetical protein
MVLAAPSTEARRILDASGLTKPFSLYDTEVAAVRACRPPGTI